MDLSFLVSVREWDVPGNPLLHEFALQADSSAAATKMAIALFHAEYPSKDIKKYFLHAQRDRSRSYLSWRRNAGF